ncbi:MAG: N-6 DNA methylase [Selenomonadaceae bacterium]|nr:N-6 DNA methylase [Selenomonadaceae bacterium]
MRSEADFTNYIQNRLADVEIFSDTQSSHIVELDNALGTASKNQTGARGYPDHIALVDDFVLVMEDKSDRLHLVLHDGGEISQSIDATTNYALNGALFYALKILDGTRYKKIFAFGNAGDSKHHIIQPIFIDEQKNITWLDTVDTFKNFTAENIDSYYRRMVLKEIPPEEVELKKILRRAELLHEHLRNYGQLGEDEKPLVVSAILLALAEGKNFNVETLTGDKIKTDGAKIFEHVENHLKRANVRPEVKKERVLSQFRLIKDRPLLNEKNRTLEKTPLKFFTEFIADKIFDAVVNKSAEDYLGRFYGEFISYSGGDGQSLGVVLTPRHIAELFCDLVDLKPDDIVFDPCCGTGSFLIAAMSRMLHDADDSQKKSIKQKQIHGIEAREDMFSIATTNMILRGDGQSNLICGDFFAHKPDELQIKNCATVGMMNPPYSQAKNAATAHLSELRFIRHLLESVSVGGRVAVIVPVSAMIGKTRDDKIIKGDILRSHTLEGVISLNKYTFYRIGTVPCIAIFTAGEPHPKSKRVKFINFEDDGFEVKKHVGLVETERAKDKKFYLLDCWRGNIKDAPSKFMVETTIEPADEWLHSFYYYNDELPTEKDFADTVADYLTFEFNMIAHGREYLFAKKKLQPLTEVPHLDAKTWKIFNLSSVFSIRATSSGIDKNELISGEGNFPYITRTDRNNGVQSFICEQPNYKLDAGNCITVGLDTQTAFYQPTDFYTGQNIQILTNDRLNFYVAQFLLPSIKNTLSIFSWGGNGATLTRLRRSKILLPVTDDGAPDFDFMEAYIVAHEEKILQRYRDFVQAVDGMGGGVTLLPLNEKIWRPFRLLDYFQLIKGDQNNMADLEAGDMPLISAKNSNNGCKDFVADNGKKIFGGDCLTLNNDGDGGAGIAYYQPTKFLLDTHVTALLPKNFLSAETLLFISRCITIQREKFGHGYSLNNKRLNVFRVMLPVTDDGLPDFDYMATFAKNFVANQYRNYLKYIDG